MSTSPSISTGGSLPGTPSSTASTGRPFAPITITDLVIAEAHYLSTLKRVGNALNLASNNSLAAGRKGSTTIRTLVERWTTMMRTHIQFHDDVVATNENAQEATSLLADMLSILEPTLADHGRELSMCVHKLSRSEKKSGHTSAEWDTALRQPFEHLAVYGEWLQRIDPNGQFTKPCLTQLGGIIYKVQMAIETNQHPKGMLKRISTFARGVIKKPSSGQLANQDSNAAPKSPSTPTTTYSVTTSEFSYATSANGTCSRADPSPSSLTGADNRIETVTDQPSPFQTIEYVRPPPVPPKMDPVRPTPPAPVNKTAAAEDDNTPLQQRASKPPGHQHRASDASMLSSVGSLTLAPSSESIHANGAGGAKNETLGRQKSDSSQKLRADKETRRATLRIGTQDLIAFKAESLQSASYVPRPSIDRLRTITKREAETKPPVKSLISFWEQANEPAVEV